MERLVFIRFIAPSLSSTRLTNRRWTVWTAKGASLWVAPGTGQPRWGGHPLPLLLFPSVCREWGGRGWIGLQSQDWLRALGGGGGNNTIKDSLMCLWHAACHARLWPCQLAWERSGQWLGSLPLTWNVAWTQKQRAWPAFPPWAEFPQVCGLSSDPNILF